MANYSTAVKSIKKIDEGIAKTRIHSSDEYETIVEYAKSELRTSGYEHTPVFVVVAHSVTAPWSPVTISGAFTSKTMKFGDEYVATIAQLFGEKVTIDGEETTCVNLIVEGNTDDIFFNWYVVDVEGNDGCGIMATIEDSQEFNVNKNPSTGKTSCVVSLSDYTCAKLIMSVGNDSREEPVGPDETITQCDYVESNGTQYVNIGYIPNKNTRVVMDMEYTGKTHGEASPFGVVDSNGKRFAACYDFNNNTYNWWYSGNINYTSSSSTKIGIPLNKKITIESSKDGEYITDQDGNTLYLAPPAQPVEEFTSPLSIFQCNDAPNNSHIYPSSMLFYGCKIYEGDELVMDMVAAKSSNGSTGLYDKISTSFFKSSKPMSPQIDINECTIHEWAESFGKQYVDTGYKPNANTKIEMVFENRRTIGDWMCPFGAENGARFTFYDHNLTDNYLYDHNGGNYLWYSQAEVGSPLNNKMKVVADSIQLSMTCIDPGGERDGLTTILTNTCQTLDGDIVTLAIFCMHRGDSYICNDYTRLYYFKIYENDVLLHNFIPVSTQSGMTGLYDTETGSFHGSEYPLHMSESTISQVETFSLNAQPLTSIAAQAEESYSERLWVGARDDSVNMWFDTQYQPSVNTSVEAKILAGSESNDASIFGSGLNYPAGFEFFIHQGDNYAYLFKSSNNQVTYESTSVGNPDGKVLNIKCDASGCEIKDEFGHTSRIRVSEGTMQSGLPPIALFCCNRNWSCDNYTRAKIYYVRIFENGELLHYFVPAVRTSDSKCGMLDKVNNSFREFENSYVPNMSDVVVSEPGYPSQSGFIFEVDQDNSSGQVTIESKEGGDKINNVELNLYSGVPAGIAIKRDDGYYLANKFGVFEKVLESSASASDIAAATWSNNIPSCDMIEQNDKMVTVVDGAVQSTTTTSECQTSADPEQSYVLLPSVTLSSSHLEKIRFVDIFGNNARLLVSIDNNSSFLYNNKYGDWVPGTNADAMDFNKLAKITSAQWEALVPDNSVQISFKAVLTGKAPSMDGLILYSQGNSGSNGYVQDGLIAMYDGENNTRDGHNPNAIKWENIGSTSDDFDSSLTGITFGENYAELDGSSFGTLPNFVDDHGNYTVEVVYKLDDSVAMTKQNLGVMLSLSGGQQIYILKEDYYNRCFISLSKAERYIYGTDEVTSSLYNLTAVSGMYFGDDRDSMTTGFLNGKNSYLQHQRVNQQTNDRTSFIGRDSAENYFNGKIYCIRIYNRTLFADEIAANYEIDKSRFGF